MTIYFTRTIVSVLSCFWAVSAVVSAQEADIDGLLGKADSLRKAYDFEKSVEVYDGILSEISDSLLRIEVEDLKILSENGAGMTDYVSTPEVVAKHFFSADEFFLFYPLPDKSWRTLPNVLDSTAAHPLVKAVYVPEGSREIFYSSVDEAGSRNIYRTELKDSLWSLPVLLNEAMTSSGDEIYPMFSPDGRQMYFASSGLYGMGGYDLYVSEWDETRNDWGPPSNMGFPFSSPYDDFLFMNTPDGKYSIFASTRECPPDSVCVYVVEYDRMPVRKSVGNAVALAGLCRLEPDDDVSKMDNASAVPSELFENEDTRRYMEKATEIRALNDSIFTYANNLDKNRILFAESDDAEKRAELTDEIMRQEKMLPFFQDSLKRATSELQAIEMKFLFSGISFDPAMLMQEADREVKGASTNYVFTRKHPGNPLEIRFEEPEKKFDYTFMILPEGRFAEDNTLPQGVVYQIQMFSLSAPAKVSQLNGLSPVFEERSDDRYTYRVGVFRQYADVLANLNKVKRAGFRSAFITAFNDGKSVPVSKARELEKEAMKTVPLFNIVIVPAGESLDETAIKAIAQMCTKDIAKTANDGRTEFTVGPFDDRDEMEKVMTAIRAAGETDVTAVRIGEKKTDN